MFFLGFGGQFLTILVTVAIPFVFLFSSTGSKITSKPVSQVKKVEHKIFRQCEIGKDTISFFATLNPNIKKSYSIPLCISSQAFVTIFSINLFSFHTGASGNKAPPILKVHK